MARAVLKQTPRPTTFYSPTYLYRKGNIFYFRYAFPSDLKDHFECSEIRLSLKTAYVREAKMLADRLYNGLAVMLRGRPMLPLEEIRRRLATLLVEDIEKQGRKLETIANSAVSKALMQTFDLDPEKGFDANLFLESARRMYTHRRYQEDIFDMLQSEKLYGPEASKLSKTEWESIDKTQFSPETFFAWYAESHASALTDNGLFSEEEFRDNKTAIAKAFMQFAIVFGEYVAKDESGDILGAQKVLQDALATVPQIAERQMPTQPLEEAEPGETYVDAVKEYVAYKLDSGAWKKKGISTNQSRLDSFVDIMGNMELHKIDRKAMHAFVGALKKLPPNRSKSKKYKGKAIAELLTMAHEHTLAPKTVNVTVEALCSFFNWCFDEEKIDKNPAKNLQIKDDRADVDLRFAFSKDELIKIFQHPKFSNGEFKKASYFWIPLIGLFTGMRLEEISQLYCQDIFQAGELWIIDINKAGKDDKGYEKEMKTKNTKRQIPIHRELIELGFLYYLESVKKTKAIRLFPDLNRTDKTASYGKQPGKQFKKVVKAVVENPEGKSFHSLRHTFGDFFKQRGQQTDFFTYIFGHELPTLASKQYGGRFQPEVLYREVIEKLDYGIDLSVLKGSRYISVNAQKNSKKIKKHDKAKQ